MTEPPLVSVIIPTYNRASDLKRAISSVVGQSYRRWEIIVVDNHSTDGTDVVVSSFCDDRISLKKIDNGGIIAASRNLGLSEAQGELVAFLDSDDWWIAEKLSACVALSSQGFDLVYHDMTVVRAKMRLLRSRRFRARYVAAPVYENMLRLGNPIFNSSVVARKKVVMDAGCFTEDPSLVTMEDFDLWIRIAKKGAKFGKAKGSLGWYWIGGFNTTSAERTERALGAFETIYGTDMTSLSNGKLPPWYTYAKGMAEYRLGRYREARSSFRCAVSIAASIPILAKSVIALLLVQVRRKRLD